jgi:hypothetical protein
MPFNGGVVLEERKPTVHVTIYASTTKEKYSSKKIL